jgi:hypothetical protein
MHSPGYGHLHLKTGMRNRLLVTIFFLFIGCHFICAQDKDCNKTNAKEIDLEIKILQAQLKPLKIIKKIDSAAMYIPICKDHRNEVQHFPNAPWMTDSCFQKYGNADTLTYKQALKFFQQLSQALFPLIQTNYHNQYLTISYHRLYIGSQTSRRSTLVVYFKRVGP